MGRVTIYSSLAALVIGAACAWLFQSSRYDAKIMEMQKDAAVALAESHRRAKEDYEYLEKVKNDAIKVHQEQVAKHKASADAARADVSRLQSNLANVPNRIQQATRSAVDSYAEKTTELLGRCSAEYQRMAERADEHYANERLLIDSWPTREQAP